MALIFHCLAERRCCFYRLGPAMRSIFLCLFFFNFDLSN
ncbi:unnamed protein product [Arabidopsis lyrata]|nr:unnamed protein product [Arabidopsis lyrata]